MKTCFQCKNTFPETEFYSNGQMPSGLGSYCKTCTKSRERLRRSRWFDQFRTGKATWVEQKQCPRCKKTLSWGCFYKSFDNKTGLSHYCHECTTIVNEGYQDEDYRNRRRAYHRGYSKYLKAKAIEAYGGRCSCCGEDDVRFLTLDHINNDGGLHRRVYGSHARSGGSFYNWLRKDGYPAGYQAFCWNCNLAKAHNRGVCPHKDGVRLTCSAQLESLEVHPYPERGMLPVDLAVR